MSQSYDRISLWGFYQYDNNVLSTLNLPSSFTSEEVETIKSNILIQSAELELYYTDLNFLKFAIDTWSKKKVPVWDKIISTLNLEYNPIENYDRLETWTDESEGETVTSGTSSSTSTREKTTEDTGSSETETSGSSSGTESGTNSKTTSASVTDSMESSTQTTGSDTETNESDSTVTNSVMGANPNEGWADHDKSVSHDESEKHGSNSGLTETNTSSESSSSSTESGSSSGTSSGTTSGTSETTTSANGSENEEVSNSGSTTSNGTSSNSSTHTGRVHGNIGVTTAMQMIEAEIELRKKYNIMDIITNDFIDEFCLRVY